jgi:uncharacterized protein (DUF983 family)
MSDAPTLTKTLLNGVKLNCPSCGAGEIFASYLKRRDACPHCGESFVGLDADDGPAWLTIGIAAHIVVPLLIFLERREWLGYYAEFIVVALATVAIVLLVLPRSKGFWISILWWNSKPRDR